MKAAFCWLLLFLSALCWPAIGQVTKYVYCTGRTRVTAFSEVVDSHGSGNEFTLKCGKRVTVLEGGKVWTKVRIGKNQVGFVASDLLVNWKPHKQRAPINWGAAIAQAGENASRTAASPRQRECLNALDVRLADLRAQGAEEQHLQALKTAGWNYCFSLQESQSQPTVPFCWQSHPGQPVGAPIYDQSEGWCVNW
jgi:hypothetical protein